MGERIKEATEHYVQDLKEVGGRLWGATQRTVSAAGSRAAHYGKRVQLRLDHSTLERKIESRYAELGRQVFAAWNEGAVDLQRREELSPILASIEELNHQREALARELEELRASREAASAEAPPPEADLADRAAASADPERSEKAEAEEELHL